MSKLNRYLKAAFFALAIMVLAIIGELFFVLLPLYEIVGSGAGDADKALARSTTLVTIFNAVIVMAMGAFIICFVIGMIKKSAEGKRGK